MQQQCPLVVFDSDTTNAGVLPIYDFLHCFAFEQKLQSVNTEATPNASSLNYQQQILMIVWSWASIL
jgi:hypothetical protein